MWTAKAETVSGRRATYLDAGDTASPNVVLLVHAFPVGMRMWEPVRVADGWRALAPALPGFDGVEPPPADSTSIDDYARFLIDLLDRLHVERAVIGGLSMGGYVTFAAWRLDPSRWRGLVLADTRAGADSAQGRAGREAMLQTVRARGTRGVAEEMVPKLLGPRTQARDPRLVQHVTRLIERQTDAGVAAAIVRLRDRPDATPLLPGIAAPALVVVGEDDSITPPSESEQMAAMLPDARLERVPGAGHLSALENAEAFGDLLGRFLSAIR